MCGLRDRAEAIGPVVAAARKQLRGAVLDSAEDAIAVELRLVEPACAFGRFRDQRCELGRRRLRQRTAVSARDLTEVQRRAAFALGGSRARGRLRAAIAALDQQPILRALALVALRHAHERPAPLEPTSVELEIELAVLEPLLRVAERSPVALIPDQHAARAVFAFRDLALEAAVFERMVLGLNREPAILGVHAWLLRHGPALENAAVLEPKVVVQAPRVVLLHDVLQAFARLRPRAARLRSPREVSLAAVRHELAGPFLAGCFLHRYSWAVSRHVWLQLPFQRFRKRPIPKRGGRFC